MKKEYKDEKKKYSSQNLECPLVSENKKEKETIAEAIKEAKEHSPKPDNILKELHEEVKSEINNEKPKSTRKSLQLPRRIFHMVNGCVTAFIYSFLTHSLAVHILGIAACVLYIFEQIRLSYPEHQKKLNKFYNYFLRAEEQLKESSMIPYVMGLLLTIISFPKLIAICSILTLGIADPLSAIVGIKYGKNHVVKEKTVEGSLAFFIACFFCIFLPLIVATSNPFYKVFFVSFLTSAMTTYIEMLPVKLDDNLTIPIFCSLALLINGAAMGIIFS